MSEALTIKEKNEKLKNFIFQKFQDNELDNSTLLQLIEQAGMYLNLCTVANYATLNKITYNGVLDRIKSGKIKEYNLFGVRFVIDNE